MKNPKKLLKDKEGVSPVIGVILMVAITVIMAAIVAGFVFGVISTPQPTPQASITIDEVNSTEVTLLHQSGDSLVANDTRIVIEDSDGTILTSTLDTITDTNSSLSVSPMFSSNEEFVSGTTVKIGNFTSLDGTVTVRIVDIPSGGTVSSPSAEV